MVWVPAGRHLGPVEVRPGGALLGECVESAVIVGKISLLGPATISDLTVEAGAEDGREVITVFGEAAAARLRVVGGATGIGAGSDANLDLESVQVTGAQLGVGGTNFEVTADHLWVNAPSNIGIQAFNSRTTLRDVVVQSTVQESQEGVLLLRDSGPAGSAQLERLYVHGVRARALVLAHPTVASDLRVDRSAIAVQLDAIDAGVEIHRLGARALSDVVFWVREEVTLHLEDLLASETASGLLLVGTSSVVLDRIELNEVAGTAISIGSEAHLTARDLKVEGARGGLAFTRQRLGEAPPPRLHRLSLRGTELGVTTTVPLRVTEGQLAGFGVGVEADGCVADPILRGFRFSGVNQPYRNQ